MPRAWLTSLAQRVGGPSSKLCFIEMTGFPTADLSGIPMASVLVGAVGFQRSPSRTYRSTLLSWVFRYTAEASWSLLSQDTLARWNGPYEVVAYCSGTSDTTQSVA